MSNPNAHLYSNTNEFDFDDQVLRARYRKRLLDNCFPAQKAFVLNEARRIVAVCTRRAAKTASIIRKIAIHDSLLGSKYRAVYVLQNKDDIPIVFGEALDDFIRQEHLNPDVIRQNYRDGVITFPYGGRLYLRGLSDKRAISKTRGTAWHHVFIDEAQRIPYSIMQSAIEGVFRQSLIDFSGKLIITGTPSEYKSSYLYSLWRNQDSTYQKIQWTALENPHVAKQFARDAKEYLQDYGNNNFYKREYLGQWVFDDTKLVYSNWNEHYYNLSGINFASPLYRSALGVDLGWDDATSFVSMFKNKDTGQIYVPFTYKSSHLTDDQIYEYIISLSPQPEVIIIDGASKQLVESMRVRYGLNFIATEKSSKAVWMSFLNDQFGTRPESIYIDRTCGDLGEELGSLMWAEAALEKQKKIEDPKCQNHLTDAILYGYRYLHPERGKVAHNLKPLDTHSSEDMIMLDEIFNSRNEPDSKFPLESNFNRSETEIRKRCGYQ